MRRFRNTYHVQLRTDRAHPHPPIKIQVEPPDEENLKAWVTEWARINPHVKVFGFDARRIGVAEVTGQG